MKQDKSKLTEEPKELAGPNIVMPAVSPEEAVEAWNAYQALKKKIASPDDIQTIQGKEFYKKSYWRKIATFFNLSVEVVKEEKEELDNNVVYHFTQKAIAPNGRFAYGVGSCDLLEKGRRNTIHNTRGTAETRAFNRAVSNLVGGGEVSAEEIVEDNPVYKPFVKTTLQPVKSITDDQKGDIIILLGKLGKTSVDLNRLVKWKYKLVDDYKKMTELQAEWIISYMKDKVSKLSVGEFTSVDDVPDTLSEKELDEIDAGIQEQKLARS